MGISPFKSCMTNTVMPAPNPSPSRWELLKALEYPNGYILQVRYLGCTNFEGIKLMVFKGQYKYRTYLDPHFEESDSSPIARFKPDSEGMRFAIDLVKNL
jgi:hypothetical protein